jgi:hypothetical protein
MVASIGPVRAPARAGINQRVLSGFSIAPGTDDHRIGRAALVHRDCAPGIAAGKGMHARPEIPTQLLLPAGVDRGCE